MFMFCFIIFATGIYVFETSPSLCCGKYSQVSAQPVDPADHHILLTLASCMDRYGYKSNLHVLLSSPSSSVLALSQPLHGTS